MLTNTTFAFVVNRSLSNPHREAAKTDLVVRRYFSSPHYRHHMEIAEVKANVSPRHFRLQMTLHVTQSRLKACKWHIPL